MEVRRVLLFVVLSALILLGWQFFVVPRLVGPARPQPAANRDKDEKPDRAANARQAEGPVAAPLPPAEEEQRADDERHQFVEQATNPKARRAVTLGSLKDDSRYLMLVTLSSQGAAIESVQLNGERFRELHDPNAPLKLLAPDLVRRNGRTELFQTFQMSVPALDKALAQLAPGVDLALVNWEVVNEQQAKDADSASFRFRIPGGKLEIIKRYTLHRVPESEDLREARRSYTDGYLVHLDVTLRNVGPEAREVEYTLLGPVGMRLENVENTRKFRDVKVAYINDGRIKAGSPVTPAEIVKAEDKGKAVDPIIAPALYAGVDAQYFAALVYPTDNPIQMAQKPAAARFIKRIQPVLLERAETTTHSDISVRFETRPRELAAGADVQDHYTLYAGPKREALLDEIAAGDVIEFGWFSWLGRGMVRLLNFFHDTLYIPYGIAIIFLTVLVRGLLFPLSIKQARNAQKMKELQPKIQELKKKYGNDKEKLARAQMELFRKHNYNMLSGCLPMFLQFPIFIALYNSLSAVVDLRRARFLWIDNLGAPDALFDLPFRVPFLGWTELNLLPVITVALFVVQQKMFLPDPNPDDEQAVMQAKMMKYMTVFLGFLFYRVPAGLCLYFIASSLWGMGERKFLNVQTNATAPADGEKKTAETSAAAGNGTSPGRDGGSQSSGRKSRSRR